MHTTRSREALEAMNCHMAVTFQSELFLQGVDVNFTRAKRHCPRVMLT